MRLKYEQIDKLLKEKGISRRQLARMLSISESTFASAFVRNSKKSISFETASAIAHILGSSLDDIAVLDVPTVDESKPTDDGTDYLRRALDSSEIRFTLKENGDLFLRIQECLDKLNLDGQQKALELVELLLNVPKYLKKGEENGKY